MLSRYILGTDPDKLQVSHVLFHSPGRAQQLAARLRDPGAAPLQLIDVREPVEPELANLSALGFSTESSASGFWRSLTEIAQLSSSAPTTLASASTPGLLR
jgi:hypothetical protein